MRTRWRGSTARATGWSLRIQIRLMALSATFILVAGVRASSGGSRRPLDVRRAAGLPGALGDGGAVDRDGRGIVAPVSLVDPALNFTFLLGRRGPGAHGAASACGTLFRRLPRAPSALSAWHGATVASSAFDLQAAAEARPPRRSSSSLLCRKLREERRTEQAVDSGCGLVRRTTPVPGRPSGPFHHGNPGLGDLPEPASATRKRAASARPNAIRPHRVNLIGRKAETTDRIYDVSEALSVYAALNGSRAMPVSRAIAAPTRLSGVEAPDVSPMETGPGR